MRTAGRARRRRLGGVVPAGDGADGRVRLVRLLVLVFLVLAAGRAVALASSADRLARIAASQHVATVTLPAHRGAILDREGRELAVGVQQETVYATPYLLSDPGRAARRLCDALQIHRRRERRAVAERLADRDSGFAYVARKVDPALAAAAVGLGLPGVGSYPEEERTYPMGACAAQVVGFAGVDNQGLAGIELAYDRVLAGRDGKEVVVRDPSGEVLRTLRRVDPRPGADVRLTLDAEVQYTAEDVLRRTVRDTGAAAATAIVMDPRSGDVLAMANVTREGFHGFGRDPEAERNRAVTDVYEPGSIFKLVTIAGALADGTVRPTTRFTLPPTIRVADRVIHEAHPRGTVRYSVGEILQWSSNVGAVRIGMLMGRQGLYRWVRRFGFGRPTGLGFPGESAGIVAPPEQWSGSSIGNIPMGQGVSVTAMQMAAAFCTVANDGVSVRPRLVAQVGTRVCADGSRRRVLPARVAREVRRMLVAAVEKGTGTRAQVPGYEVAGKTGTAQKPLPDGSGYSKCDYVASFVGMAPARRPRLVVLVTVDEPRTSIYGGDVAAPAFAEIMAFALHHFEVAP